MKQNKIRVCILKTFYPHWGRHTAFNSFLSYFNRSIFDVTMKNVPMGGDKFIQMALPRFIVNGLMRKNLPQYRLNDLWAEIRLFGQTFFKNIDIVHFIDAEHSMFLLPVWFKKLGSAKKFPKIVGMFHQPPKILENIVSTDIAGLADHVLTVAPQQAEYFSRFIPAERISTILHGIDTKHFKPLSTKKDTMKFKCLAGGIWLRDYEAVFNTAKILEGVSEIEFHVVSPKFKKAINLKNVIFHENITDDALMDLYQNSHVSFMPMQDATANNVLLEGCACGLPIISSDLPAIKVYYPGEEAILVKENKPHDFAEALTALHYDRAKLERMSQCARQRALQLSWEVIIKEYEQMYLKLCGM